MRQLPSQIAGIAVPQDAVSAMTWQWAERSLPHYLVSHSVRAYCWGTAIAAREGWTFDRQVLWTASLMHDDGVESVLLDRATGIDVRGYEYELIDDVRSGVMRAFPRRAFDRHFVAAIRREVAIRPTCQSDRLLHETGLVEWMERSPWAERLTSVA